MPTYPEGLLSVTGVNTQEAYLSVKKMITDREQQYILNMAMWEKLGTITDPSVKEP